MGEGLLVLRLELLALGSALGAGEVREPKGCVMSRGLDDMF